MGKKLVTDTVEHIKAEALSYAVQVILTGVCNISATDYLKAPFGAAESRRSKPSFIDYTSNLLWVSLSAIRYQLRR